MSVTPKQVVDQMTRDDAFSRWMGVEVLEVHEGYAKIKMTMRPEMMNGLGIAHGGIAFSLADSAFAFACNSRNIMSYALDNSMNFLRPVMSGDILSAEATEMHNGRTTGLYQVIITNQHGKKVAFFKGTCYRTGKPVVG